MKELLSFFFFHIKFNFRGFSLYQDISVYLPGKHLNILEMLTVKPCLFLSKVHFFFIDIQLTLIIVVEYD